MAVKIRPIVLQDAASYRQCFDAVAKEGRYKFEDKAPPLSEVRKRLQLSLQKKTPFLVAVDGERVVGWAAMFSSDAPSLSHNGIFAISLLAEYRGKGLGTKLMAKILKMSQGRFDWATLEVWGKNKHAQKLYKKMGFKVCGRITRQVKLSYGFDDEVIMQKRLRN